jgi:hypothetical protein
MGFLNRDKRGNKPANTQKIFPSTERGGIQIQQHIFNFLNSIEAINECRLRF